MPNFKNVLKQTCKIALSITIMITACTATYVKADDDITNELKKEVIPLKTVDPKEDLKDLMPLKEILKNKEIVAMGEATHGTSEFFKMKHRVYKFLVQEMGYRAFAIEANFGEGEIINDYILNGVGGEYKALTTFNFWTWQTNEVKEMLNWMREYNLKAKDKDKIRFYGCDMQDMSKEHSILRDYFHKTKPELGTKLFQNVESNINLEDSKAKDTLNKNKEVMKEIIKDVENSKDELIKKSSSSEYEVMVKNLDIMNQCLDLLNCRLQDKVNTDNPQHNYSNLRDKYMAENIKWIKNREETLGNNKIMVWAHNGHVNNYDSQQSGYTRMGKYLKDFYGDKYYILGFEFFKGKFRAINNGKLIENELSESNDKTLGHLFNKLEIPIFYIDFKKALANDKVNHWFKNKEVFINFIGALYDNEKKDEYIYPININKEYDGLIFINETTAAKEPVYNQNKSTEPQKCGTKDTVKTSTTTIVVTTGIIFLVGLICAGVIKNKKASK